jgi:methylglutaconyl-CoA hydratase
MTTPSARPGTAPLVAEGSVHSDVQDGIGRIEFQHPKGNSLPGALLTALAGEVQRLGDDPGARVIVLQSGGLGPFCAGASFDELVAIDSEARGQEFFSGFARVILAMIRAPKFVITRIHGKAAGGAVGLIAASDYSIAVRGASAKLSELAIGIGPFVVGPVIQQKIGLAAFSAMTVDADWRDAGWCERHGLYSRVVDDMVLETAVDTMARTLADSNPDSMAELKRVFWAGTEQWDELLARRAGISGRMVLSDFSRNAIANFRAR